MPIWDKIKTVATRLYRADDIIADQKIRDQIRKFEETGLWPFPGLYCQDSVQLFN